MSLTPKEFWTVVHGLLVGAVFLLAFSAGFVGLWSLRSEFLTAEGIRERIPRLKIWTGLMALVGWATVITGTYIVYPWYRAKPPEGTTDLLSYPRSYLLADPSKAAWHTLGMEWKEHIGWISPILATAVFFLVLYYGPQLAKESRIRQAALLLFAGAFLTAAVAGVFGAFLNKAAPIL